MNLEFERPIEELEAKIAELKKLSAETDVDFSAEIYELEKRCQVYRQEVYSNLSPWDTVQLARHPQRPVLQDYISLLFDEFIELHGDRTFGDDRGLIGGFARFDDLKVMLIGHNKGKNVEENIERNFGMAKPEGYRKALRLMKVAEKYNVPILTFIDTAGAFPGLEAEERGQAEAIARNLTEMARIEVPIISLVTGEGGSGGAIGIGVGDVILMLSNSVYSVISPEGCASILWRDAVHAPKAADAMKITADSLKELGVIDQIIKEPVGGAHKSYGETVKEIKKVLKSFLLKLNEYSTDELLERRFKKYSGIGRFNS
jgi:acetyl-CoA carboxylase carboxyl transferase subunit alpha